MDFKSSTKFYLTLFFMLGISSYQPNQRYSPPLMFICKMFKFALAAICEIAGIFSLCLLNRAGAVRQHSQTEIILINMYLVCDLLRALFILLQCLIFKKSLNEITDLLHSLEIYFATQLDHRILYRKFTRRFTFKLILILGFCSLYLFSFYMRWMVGDRLSQASTILKMLQVMTAFCYLHIVFYIDILSFYFKQLNLVVHRDMLFVSNGIVVESLNQSVVKQRLQCYKVVHFRLWMVSQRVNRYFGYGLIAILMHAFTDLVYSALWIFQNLHTELNFRIIWSKFDTKNLHKWFLTLN